MKILSVFVDESGDFGQYSPHSPYYIVTLAFHDQSVDMSEDIRWLDNSVYNYNLQGRAIHTGPLIRREGDYINTDGESRRQIFNRLFNFSRKVAFSYKTIFVDKKHTTGDMDLHAKLSKQLSHFLLEKNDYFNQYDKIIVYYDNGQIDLTKILVSLFNAFLNNVEFRKILPSDYKMAQVADLLCTLELLSLKLNNNQLSKSELYFFDTLKKLEKNYIKSLRRKMI